VDDSEIISRSSADQAAQRGQDAVSLIVPCVRLVIWLVFPDGQMRGLSTSGTVAKRVYSATQGCMVRVNPTNAALRVRLVLVNRYERGIVHEVVGGVGRLEQ